MSQMCPNCSFNNTDEAKKCSRCSTPLRDLLGENTMLSQRYTLVSVLGCGAMGAVYLGEDKRLVGRRCAIKENLPDPNAPVNVQDQSREQFLAEARVLARLDHPNLPKVSDYFIENGREYLVMDYVEGEDLESRMTRTKKPLAEAEVIGWVDQTLDALSYLHNQKPQPIIHRDIKPANLRVDLYNRVKLVDFGLVKLFDADSPETKAELRGVGTPAYAPIEQFAGSEEHTDARSDIYSLGATLYHLLTNLPPIEVHKRLLKPESLFAPRSLNDKLSKHVENVILQAIQIYPNDRYQTAAEMRQALVEPLNQLVPAGAAPTETTILPENSASGSKPSSESNSSGISTTSSAQKSEGGASPWIFGAIGLAVVLLILSGFAWAVFSGGFTTAPTPSIPTRPSVAQQLATTGTPPVAPVHTNTPTRVIQETATDDAPTPEPTATPPPTRTPSATPTQAAVVAAPAGIPANSLTGTIAYPVFNGSSYDIYFGQADGSGTRFFRADASQPAFSPAGNRIAFHSWKRDQRGLVTANVAGGNGILVSNFVEDQLPTFSADGSQIVLLSRRSGSRKSQLFRANSLQEFDTGVLLGEGEYPAIGGNGQLVFKGWGSTGNGLRLASPTFEDITMLTDNDQDTAPALSPDGQRVAFMSRRSGNWDIYLVNVDGSNLQRLTEDPAQDGLPAWSPDGEVVAFASNRDGQWAIWAMTPAGEDQQQLFEMQGSPDGFVGNDNFASRGWAEERISWTR